MIVFLVCHFDIVFFFSLVITFVFVKTIQVETICWGYIL